jgi:hypothetical protein
MILHVTSHAIERYIRRVEAVTERAAYLALTTELIHQAAASGMSAVILPSGHKIILAGHVIVTVKPKHCRKRRCRT